MEADQLLNTKQAAELLNVPVGTLRWWRHLGDAGPKSFTLGSRKVMYRRSDVIAWIERQYAAADTKVAG